MELTSDYDDEWFVRRSDVVITTDDHAYELHGEVSSSIPLRNRRDGMVTRITEGMTRWTSTTATGAGFRSTSTRSSMTSPSAPPSVSDGLAAALAPVLGAPVEITELRKLTGGASRETWSFTACGEELILRRDPPKRPAIPAPCDARPT